MVAIGVSVAGIRVDGRTLGVAVAVGAGGCVGVGAGMMDFPPQAAKAVSKKAKDRTRARGFMVGSPFHGVPGFPSLREL